MKPESLSEKKSYIQALRESGILPDPPRTGPIRRRSVLERLKFTPPFRVNGKRRTEGRVTKEEVQRALKSFLIDIPEPRNGQTEWMQDTARLPRDQMKVLLRRLIVDPPPQRIDDFYREQLVKLTQSGRDKYSRRYRNYIRSLVARHVIITRFQDTLTPADMNRLHTLWMEKGNFMGIPAFSRRGLRRYVRRIDEDLGNDVAKFYQWLDNLTISDVLPPTLRRIKVVDVELSIQVDPRRRADVAVGKLLKKYYDQLGPRLAAHFQRREDLERAEATTTKVFTRLRLRREMGKTVKRHPRIIEAVGLAESRIPESARRTAYAVDIAQLLNVYPHLERLYSDHYWLARRLVEAIHEYRRWNPAQKSQGHLAQLGELLSEDPQEQVHRLSRLFLQNLYNEHAAGKLSLSHSDTKLQLAGRDYFDRLATYWMDPRGLNFAGLLEATKKPPADVVPDVYDYIWNHAHEPHMQAFIARVHWARPYSEIDPDGIRQNQYEVTELVRHVLRKIYRIEDNSLPLGDIYIEEIATRLQNDPVEDTFERLYKHSLRKLPEADTFVEIDDIARNPLLDRQMSEISRAIDTAWRQSKDPDIRVRLAPVVVADYVTDFLTASNHNRATQQLIDQAATAQTPDIAIDYLIGAFEKYLETVITRDSGQSRRERRRIRKAIVELWKASGAVGIEKMLGKYTS